jgi:hypothetical protein
VLPEAVRKRSRANKAQNCFLYCPSSDRGNSAIRLYIDEIEEDFLRSDRMRVFSHSLAPKRTSIITARVARVGSHCFLTPSDVAKLQISFRSSCGVDGVSARSLRPRI